MQHFVIITCPAAEGATEIPQQPDGAKGPALKVSVLSFKNGKYAAAVAANQGGVEGVTTVVATDEEKDNKPVGLKDVPTATMVLLYNTIRPEKPIKKFADRDTAERRMKGVLEVLAKPGEAPSQEELEKQAGTDNTNEPQEGDDMAAKKGRKRAAKTTTRKAASDNGERTGRPSAFAGKVIRKVATENPRREGTHGYNSWELIKNGMSYEKYIEAGGRRQDLAWDLERGYVKLEKA
jgi:hypothetical protein